MATLNTFEAIARVAQARRRSPLLTFHSREAVSQKWFETRLLPRSLAPTLVALPSMSLIPSAPLINRYI
jgi:hypothetical protein